MYSTLIALKVFTGGTFDGCPKNGGNPGEGLRCCTIHNIDRDMINFFDLEDMLERYSYCKSDSIYYLKPGYAAPDGLVLVHDDTQCRLLLDDHIGKETCSIYIVPPPHRQVSSLSLDCSQSKPSSTLCAQRPTKEVATDGDNGPSSDNDSKSCYDLEDEEELNVKSDFIFEGDNDDDDLYATGQKKGEEATKEADERHDKGKNKAIVVESERAIMRARRAAKNTKGKEPDVVYLADEPDDGNRSPERDEEDGPTFVSRSRGLDGICFDESTMKHPHIEIGMLFTCGQQFREALKNLIICEGREVKRLKDEGKKISAKCLGAECPWYIYASSLPGEATFKVKKFVNNHICGRSHTVKQMDSKWVSNEYEEFFRSDKDWKGKALKDTVLRDTQIDISKHKAYRAKRDAQRKILGDHNLQYKRIQDYAHTLLASNPGSKVVLKCDVSKEASVNPRFKRIFISFKAQIDGFKNGCRPFIGLDGTHVKLPNGCQILAATSRDGNNNMFPIAFALAESENIHSWTWFCEILRDCVGSGEEFGGWVIISDRQKGLLGAVFFYPTAEHRYCIRHIHANFVAVGYRGEWFKKEFENAAYAYREHDHLMAMEAIKLRSLQAWEYLNKIPRKHWRRYTFTSRGKTDLVVNNISETYNSSILEAREEPVVTMLEHMRTKIMVSFEIKCSSAEQDNWQIAPNYKKRLELEKTEAKYCRPTYAGRGIWQVAMGTNQFVVDLNRRTCGCRKWDVTGIPCSHAVSAIQTFKHKPEDYVDDFFKRDKYIRAYQEITIPIPDQTQWVKTTYPDVDPPLWTPKPGRPKKKRRKAAGEPNVPESISKKKTIQCSFCDGWRHNSAGCAKKKALLRADVGPSELNDQGAAASSQSTTNQDREPLAFKSHSMQNEDQTFQPHQLINPEPVFMGGDLGFGMFHEVEGGPTLEQFNRRTTKLQTRRGRRT